MGLLWPFVWTVWVLSPRASSVWGLSVSPVPPSAVPAPDTENWNNMTYPNSGNSTGWTCAVLQPPRLGSLHVEMGTGVSLGSVLVFWCPDGYQLVGSEKVTCLVKGGIPQWSNHLPVCETLPRPGNRGLRVAVMMSVASGIVILAMSVSFIMCCLHEHLNKRKESHWGTSKRHSHRPSFWRGERWLEQEAGDWEAFPPLRVFHLPHRLDQSPPSCSSLSLSGFNGYENHGYQRSQESLLTAPKPGIPPSGTGSQGYPGVALHGVPTPSAPVADQAPPPLPVVSAWHRSLGTPDLTADDIT